MEYKRFGNKVFVRIDKGEEILEQLQNVCQKENITLAEVKALGALSEYTVGLFDPAVKQYHSSTFTGPAEITSLWGTVTTMDGKFYAHIHLSAGDAEHNVKGGHMNKAIVGATCEMILDVVEGTVERELSPEIGLNIFKFL
jgi:predicted DNA-binding protein with PD1-like motif